MTLKVHKKSRSLSPVPGLVILLCVLYLAVSQSPAVTGSDKPNAKVEQVRPVRTLHSPGLPIKIEGRVLPSNNERKEWVLKYSVTNLTDSAIHGVELGLYIFDSNSRVRGGQMWRLPVDLAADGTQVFSIGLDNRPESDDSFVLAVERVRQGRRVWQVDVIPFLGIAKISVTKNALATARFASYQDDEIVIECPADFCEKQANKAADVCSAGDSCGIDTFGCDQNRCTSSFTCHKCPRPPGGN